MPPEGKPKGGDPASRVGGWLQRINAAEGPEIHFTGKCDTAPNTTLYHVALEYVRERHGAAAQHQVAARLFKAYYHDGIYPNQDNLVSLAVEALPSIQPESLRSALQNPTKSTEVQAYARDLKQKFAVNGVPYFLINGVPAFSGAQDPETFIQAFAMAPPLPTAAAAE